MSPRSSNHIAKVAQLKLTAWARPGSENRAPHPPQPPGGPKETLSWKDRVVLPDLEDYHVAKMEWS